MQQQIRKTFLSRIRSCEVFVLGFVVQLIACGGGGGASGPPPVPNFTLAVTPASQSLYGGNSASVSLLATGINGFTSDVSIQVNGGPAGVTVSPANITLTPGVTQQIIF